MRGGDPARQTIRDIRAVAMRRDALAQVAGSVHRARVVQPGRNVKRRDVARARLIDTLRQAVAVVRPRAALADHARNDVLGTRILHYAGDIAVAGRVAVVVLHQAGVADAEVGRGDADAAAGLLENGGEDEAVVHFGLLGDLLDGVVDGSDLGAVVIGLGVLRARGEHYLLVVVEPVRIGVS